MSEIDVSGCKYFDEQYCSVNKHAYTYCNDNNCYFKQLQLEKQNAQDTYDMWKASLESIKILRKENEELKNSYRLTCLKCEYMDYNELKQKLEKIKDLLITCKNNFEKPCTECKYSEQCSEIDTDSYILQIITGEEE